MRVKIRKLKRLKISVRRGPHRHVLQIRVVPSIRLTRRAWPRARLSFGSLLSWGFKFTAMTLVIVMLGLSLFSAFEAHIINISAELVQIDPPTLTPPGNQIPWHNLIGGTDLTGTVDVFFSDPDPDATHLYFTYAPGIDPLTVPDPVCGQTGPNGGGDEKIPIELVALSLTSDTVIKAIACDGDGSVLPVHPSVINTKIYYFKLACPAVDVFFPYRGAVLAAGASSANDDILAQSNVDIDGNVRSNHDIRGSNPSPTRTITGHAIAVNNVQETRFIISGSLFENATSTVLPDIQIPTWQDRAQDGGTVNGSIIIQGSSGTTNLGPTEIMGNLTIEGNNTVNVLGPLYVHGNFDVDSNVVFNQDTNFGDEFVTIIVDGTINISSNVDFVGSGTIGAFLLVSTSLPLAADDAAIEIANDASDLGDAVLYAANGDVRINSNRTVLAIFSTAGTEASAPAVHLESNVTVNWRELPDTISCGEKFVRTDQMVINEFMPNPSGTNTDQGAAGGVLDGEWVELYNGMSVPVNVDGWVLYDENDPNELFISATNVSASSTIVYPGDYVVVYRDGDGDFALNNTGGDEVRLYNAEIGLGGSLVDNHVYAGDADDGKSFSRIPDGTNNWIDPQGTPGETNIQEDFFITDTTPTEPIIFESDPDEYDGLLDDDPAIETVPSPEPVLPDTVTEEPATLPDEPELPTVEEQPVAPEPGSEPTPAPAEAAPAPEEPTT